MNTLVLGLGNPVLGDDGVGWRIADAVEARLDPRAPVEVDRSSAGGLTLMERLVGYDRVILADAVRLGGRPAGAVLACPLAALPDPGAGHTGSAHDATLAASIELARALGASPPGRVDVVAVETPEAFTFTESLSPAVASAVPRAAAMILDSLDDTP